MSDGTPPPATRTPSRANGTLVEAAQAVPKIPGLPYSGLYVPAAKVDPGVDPPRELGRYTVLVPHANADGMAVAGIRMPVIEVPRATYTGWNPRAEGYGAGALPAGGRRVAARRDARRSRERRRSAAVAGGALPDARRLRRRSAARGAAPRGGAAAVAGRCQGPRRRGDYREMISISYGWKNGPADEASAP